MSSASDVEKVSGGVFVRRNRSVRSILLIPALFLSLCGISLYGQTPDALVSGISAYQNGRYAEALRNFRSLLSNPATEAYQGDGYLWVGKTYIAMNEYSEAAGNIEFFLANFPENRLRPEGIYQKGRLLYLEGDYEASIQILYRFINQYQDDPYRANAYFWIGESLYSLGHFGEAEKVYDHLIEAFPASFKVEAARYRQQLIQFKYREDELVKLLKISHEEYLEAIGEFLQREKAYEQALSEYQKRLAVVLGEDTQAELDRLNAELNQQRVSVSRLEEENRQLRRDLEAAGSGSASVASSPRISATDTASVRELLEIKAQALELKEFYLGLIEKGGDGE